MGVVPVIVDVDLCPHFPLGSLSMLGIDIPQSITGLVEVQKKCQRCRDILIWLFTFPLFSNKNFPSG